MKAWSSNLPSAFIKRALRTELRNMAQTRQSPLVSISKKAKRVLESSSMVYFHLVSKRGSSNNLNIMVSSIQGFMQV